MMQIDIRDIATENTIFKTSRLPKDERCMATVGNGYLATIVYSDVLYMNGLYNGAGSRTHRAKIPSPCNLRMSLNSSASELTEVYVLDIKKGIFSHQIKTKDFTIQQQIYAHQLYVQLLVSEFTIQRNESYQEPITVALTDHFHPDTPDLDFSISTQDSVRYLHGRIVTAESATSGHPEIHMYCSESPSELTLPAGDHTHTWTLLSSLSLDKRQSLQLFEIGVDLAEKGPGLRNSHVDAWHYKWEQGCVNVDGDLFLSKATYACMYYILSSLPPLTARSTDFIFYGLSPGSLATGGKTHDDDYNGHVFWDMETWMYPPILLFHPSLAKMMLMYRVRNLEAAKRNASPHGYKGAMFPWESAYSGVEVCPGAAYADYEQHITGDIALAIQQYLSVTRDEEFLLQDGGWELITGIAEFWESRAEMDQSTGKYVIKGVMPPDEYHRCVDNSVYTNVVAKISLCLPSFAAKLIGRSGEIPSQWSMIADNLYIPFDDLNQYHLEFDGYTLGTEVKQADVILLGHPLNYEMPPHVRRNDLVNYDKVTDQWGPAMTWSMFAIGWLELAEYQKAYDVFQRCFANIQEPFKTWTEVADGSGAYNFITGMGGFLQTVIFGNGGFRIYTDHLEFNPVLPTETNKLTYSGIKYLGASFDIEVGETMVTITMVTKTESAAVLVLVHKETEEVFEKGKPLQKERSKYLIREQSTS